MSKDKKKQANKHMNQSSSRFSISIFKQNPIQYLCTLSYHYNTTLYELTYVCIGFVPGNQCGQYGTEEQGISISRRQGGSQQEEEVVCAMLQIWLHSGQQAHATTETYQCQ